MMFKIIVIHHHVDKIVIALRLTIKRFVLVCLATLVHRLPVAENVQSIQIVPIQRLV